MSELYLIALGSNQRHVQFGLPRDVLVAAVGIIDGTLGDVRDVSPVITSDPVGPSQRQYANGALLLETQRRPQELLRALKLVEHFFGRRPCGQRWSARVLDLDIVLWSGGCFAGNALIIPHLLFRERAFVLGPATAIAPDWRDPVSGLSLSQLHTRLTQPRPLPR